MEEAYSLRRLIRSKLRDGSLPWNSIPRVWGGKGANEVCSACGEKVPPEALVMEGIGEKMRSVQFHVACFHLWDVERRLGPGSLKQGPDRSIDSDTTD